jgi:glucose/arabinose dehydrogenase
VEIAFSGTPTIETINVITVQDNFSAPSPPDENMTFTLYGITVMDVQYWNGSAFVTVPGGSISGNNKVWRKITFAPIATSRIRVLINDTADHFFSRITEIEAFTPGAAQPNPLLPGFSAAQVAGGLPNPTAMAFAPDGRLFVCQQTGQLRVIRDGALLPDPFVTLTVSSAGERGLLGVTFDPNFANNHFVYVYYTATTPAIHNRVSRFEANGDVAVPGSETTILDLNNLSSATNHNGGAIHFGPDGKLYIAVGENANGANSQTLTNLLGKMLRINADGSIPSDNPFFNIATGNNRAIWALGLRNPFTFGFQNGTGRMFLNDVGEVTWEEINDGIAGSNYGWPNCEGICGNPSFRDPLFQYGHGTGPATGCAIVGAAFYNPAIVTYPSDYLGKYFYADLCSGWIRRFEPATASSNPFAINLSTPVDLQIGPDGNLYYLVRGGGGVVVKVTYSSA